MVVFLDKMNNPPQFFFNFPVRFRSSFHELTNLHTIIISENNELSFLFFLKIDLRTVPGTVRIVSWFC